MTTARTSPASTTSNLPSPVLLDTIDTPQERITFLQSQRQLNTNTLKLSPNAMADNRTPSSLLELKQRRLIAAADRKKRIITRIITIVGLLIILLCAAIVTLTLKMAPKIDELVRTKSGTHPLAHALSRMPTPITPPTIEWINSTTNNSP